MRYTVLVSDLLVFLSAVVALLPLLHRRQQPSDASSESSESRFVSDITAAVDGGLKAGDSSAVSDVGTRTVCDIFDVTM